MAKLDGDELAKYMGVDPRLNPWGIYSRDPWPEGVRVFFWFETESELRTRLADGSFDVTGDEEDWEPVAAGMTSALTEIKELSPTDVEVLNSKTNGGFDIHWLGRFEDLLIGDSPVALELREAWRYSNECTEEVLTNPIEADEVQAFGEFINQYGF